MIKDNMFYGDPTLKDYRDMDIREIIREYLLTKGTWGNGIITKNGIERVEINHEVHPEDLVTSGLFVYGLKDNPTNRTAVAYYCERWGRIHQIMDGSRIKVPDDLWNECDKKNLEFTFGNDRTPHV